MKKNATPTSSRRGYALRLRAFIRDKKGMTLTELLVGLILFSIIATAVATVFVPVLNVYDKANELAECNALLDNVANLIIGDLSESTAEPGLGALNTVSITTAGAGSVIYTVGADGVLLRNGAEIFSKDFYGNKSVGFSCSRNSGAANAYTLSVSVTLDNYGYGVSRDYAVRPLALNQYR